MCNEDKCLGNYITEDLSDDQDIDRQCYTLYAQGKTLILNLGCALEVKTTLLKAYWPLPCILLVMLKLKEQYAETSHGM